MRAIDGRRARAARCRFAINEFRSTEGDPVLLASCVLAVPPCWHNYSLGASKRPRADRTDISRDSPRRVPGSPGWSHQDYASAGTGAASCRDGAFGAFEGDFLDLPEGFRRRRAFGLLTLAAAERVGADGLAASL